MRDDLEVLLQNSLKPQLTPPQELNQRILGEAKENKVIKFKPVKAMNSVVKAAVIILAVFGLATLSVSAATYIYEHFFVSKVGFIYGDEEDVEIFESYNEDEVYYPTVSDLLDDVGDDTVKWYKKSVTQNDEDTVLNDYYYKNYEDLVSDAMMDEWLPDSITKGACSFASMTVITSPREVYSEFDVIINADIAYGGGEIHICETWCRGTDKDPENYGYSVYIENPVNTRTYTNKNGRSFTLVDESSELGRSFTSFFYPVLKMGYISFQNMTEDQIHEVLDQFVEPHVETKDFVFPEKPGVEPIISPVQLGGSRADSNDISEGGDVNREETAENEEKEAVNLVECLSDFGYVTSKPTTIETEYVIYDIDENIYVPNDLVEVTDKTCKAIEKVTGLNYNKNKTRVSLAKNNVTEKGISKSEVFSAYSAFGDMTMGAADLFLGNSDTFIHEMTHELEADYDGSAYPGQMLTEGFASYVTAKVLEYFEENDQEMAVRFQPSKASVINVSLGDEKAIFKQNLDYWMENGYEYAANGLYAVGIRFVAYLKDTYGDYTGWIEAANKIGKNPFSTQEQVDMLKEVYGESVIDGFYPWLKAHDSEYSYPYGYTIEWDLTKIHEMVIFPEYNVIENRTSIGYYQTDAVKVENLVIKLEPLRDYISSYKKDDIYDLTIHSFVPIDVSLLDRDGNEIRRAEGVYSTSVEGASAVKILGSVKTTISFDGYESYSTYDEGDDNFYYSKEDLKADLSEDMSVYDRIRKSINSGMDELVLDKDGVYEDKEWLSTPGYLNFSIDKGAVITFDGYLDIWGTISYESGSLICRNGRYYLNPGAVLIRGKMKVEAVTPDNVTVIDGYATSFGVDDYGKTVEFWGGPGSTLRFSGISREEFDQTVKIDSIHHSTKIELNGEDITSSLAISNYIK